MATFPLYISPSLWYNILMSYKRLVTRIEAFIAKGDYSEDKNLHSIIRIENDAITEYLDEVRLRPERDSVAGRQAFDVQVNDRNTLDKLFVATSFNESFSIREALDAFIATSDTDEDEFAAPPERQVPRGPSPLDILDMVDTALLDNGIKVGKARKKDLRLDILLAIRSKTPLVKIWDEDGGSTIWGGYRDPSFDEIEDGCGGITHRYILTDLATGDRMGSLSKRADDGTWRMGYPASGAVKTSFMVSGVAQPINANK